MNPILAGQGGSFTANASGYNSLFKNPAGFAMDGGDFTLLSANVWSFADQSLIDFAMDPNGIEAYYTNMGNAAGRTGHSRNYRDLGRYDYRGRGCSDARYRRLRHDRSSA